MGSQQFSDQSHAEIYNIYRPDIPEEIGEMIVSFLREKFQGCLQQAVDVGCGSGQSSGILAPFFEEVTGIDGSEAQINEAKNSRTWPNINFTVGPAEILPFANDSVQLVTACAALHWFKKATFFSEVRRILSPNGVFAAYTYHYVKPFSKDPECVAKIDKLFSEKCEELNPYYCREVFSSLDKYEDIYFPFEEVLRPPDVRQIFDGKLVDVIGYMKTLSGFQNMMKEDAQKAERFISTFTEKMKEILKLEKAENCSIKLYRDFYLVFCRKCE